MFLQKFQNHIYDGFAQYISLEDGHKMSLQKFPIETVSIAIVPDFFKSCFRNFRNSFQHVLMPSEIL